MPSMPRITATARRTITVLFIFSPLLIAFVAYSPSRKVATVVS
jgi:hypothetical protein